MDINLEACLARLQNGESLAIATILTKNGSAPRGPGAKMAVFSDGRISGTIGGGKLEELAMKAGLEVIREKRARKEYFCLTRDDYKSIDMTCGGNVDVLLEYVGGEADAKVFRVLTDSFQNQVPASWITAFQIRENSYQVNRGVVHGGNILAGNLPDWAVNSQEPKEDCAYRYLPLADGGVLRTAVCPVKTVLVIGGGHVGQKVAELAHFAGFNVKVIDDRQEFAFPSRFPYASGVYAIDEYRDIFNVVFADEDTCIVIVTRGHVFDRRVLEQSLKTDAGYIGMIGSRKKVKTLFDSMLSEGWAGSEINRVHSPIGLEIGAETPAEIAVSILGEIIAFIRNTTPRC